MRSTPTRVGNTPRRRLHRHRQRSTPTRVGNTAGQRERRKRHAVHPHARGEHDDVLGLNGSINGPPPRAWGTRYGRRLGQAPRRSTPTRVGNTDGRCRCRAGWSVHPHARGEHAGDHQVRPGRDGPPPRAWGTRKRSISTPQVERSTPTRVGNTLPQGICWQPLAVHPHARGEHAKQSPQNWFRLGPPPRAWGTRVAPRPRASAQRSTPTRVGNTRRRSSPGGPTLVHPHARGEHRTRRGCAVRHSGPPPRAWGTHLCQTTGSDIRRSTPTRVGNTPPSPRRRRCDTVHPHARGEHARAMPTTRPQSGPPPRAWGTLDQGGPFGHALRSTPTRVGNTHPSGPRSLARPVHPHARGEHAA